MPRNLLPVPHIAQQHNADCLAACAAMLLAYANVVMPYPRLLRIVNVQPFGMPGRNLYRLSQVGVAVIYREGSMSILEEVIAGGQPCIVLVRTEFLPYWSYTTAHAVVVAGVEDDGVFVHDPAFAQYPMRVAKLEFELAWLEFNYRYCVLATGSTPRA